MGYSPRVPQNRTQLSNFTFTFHFFHIDGWYISNLLNYRMPQVDFYNIILSIEENNRMGKTRDLFKKIRDTKGIFHAKMGSIKDRNGRDPTEAEDIGKR